MNQKVKKMKKLLLLLLVVVGMSSCFEDVKKSVKDPKEATTIRLQELPKDTVVISTDEHNLYVFDENNLVVAKTVAGDSDAVPISFFDLLIITAAAFLLGLVVGLKS